MRALHAPDPSRDVQRDVDSGMLGDRLQGRSLPIDPRTEPGDAAVLIPAG